MLVAHLRFCKDCQEAIALYERAFHAQARDIVRNDDGTIAPAVMSIHGQRVFLNDRFGVQWGFTVEK